MQAFTDADAAALYDKLNPWDGTRFASDAFYDELVMAAGAVLDVGCGTGAMLGHAPSAGHRGRLVGLDPDLAALRRERHDDIEWVAGVAADARWDREFDLAAMTSHAFQFLVEPRRPATPTARRCTVDRTRMRFLDVPTLDAFLVDAGFALQDRYGDWGRGPVTSESREIITVARRA